MNKNLVINHLFVSLDDILARAGATMGQLLRRLARKYKALKRYCNKQQMLLAVSMAWGLVAEAENGNVDVLRHFDEATHLRQQFDSWVVPPPGIGYTLMVQGEPFYFGEDDRMMEHFFWDSFAMFLNQSLKADGINPVFFDIADQHQWKAFEVEAEMRNEDSNTEREQEQNQKKALLLQLQELKQKALLQQIQELKQKALLQQIQEIGLSQQTEQLLQLEKSDLLKGATIEIHYHFDGDFTNYGTLSGNSFSLKS